MTISPPGEIFGRQGEKLVLESRQGGDFFDEFGKPWSKALNKFF